MGGLTEASNLLKEKLGKVIQQDEPICGIATPAGEGGVAVIRVSGLGVISKVGMIFRGIKKGLNLEEVKSHRVLYGSIFSMEQQKFDEVLLLIMKTPNSYTREDVIEVHCHGGTLSAQRILQLLCSLGIRLAEPGEFTKRAFLNGRIDLAQAEAVMELIRAKTDAGYDTALKQLSGGLSEKLSLVRKNLLSLLAKVEVSIDFCEEDIDFINPEAIKKEIQEIIEKLDALFFSAQEGVLIRDGIRTVIVGRTNVGKSSLLNRLVRCERAIVTPFPGTTRDLLEESSIVGGILLRIIDTAGVRLSEDPVELEGIRRGRLEMERADLVLLVLDRSEPLSSIDRALLLDTKGKKRILVLSKIDKEKKWGISRLNGAFSVEVSTITGEGILALHDAIKNFTLNGFSKKTETPVTMNMRQKEAVRRARDYLSQCFESANNHVSEELLAPDLREAYVSLGEVTGSNVAEEVLSEIFRGFCIGK